MPTTKPTFTPTPEQQYATDEVVRAVTNEYLSNTQIFIKAKAGTGKTALVKHIIRVVNPDAFLYTAFNTRIVAEFESPNAVTFHALAKRAIRHTKGISALYASSASIKQKIPYSDKLLIVESIEKYYTSRHLTFSEYLKDSTLKLGRLANKIATDLIKNMSKGVVPATFNYLLKECHLQLHSGKLVLNTDMLFIDEAQDVTPVMLEIFALIEAKVKVFLGDSDQEIYSFLDLVTVFNSSVKTLDLTNSFRVSPEIAKKIESFGRTHIDPTFKFKGLNTSGMPKKDFTTAIITHTNASIIELTHKYHEEGVYPSYTRPLNEIFKVALKVESILNNPRSVKDFKYKELVNLISKNFSVNAILRSETIHLDDDILSALAIVWSLSKKGISTKYILNVAKTHKPNPKFLIGTVFAIKGLEFDRVIINEDLNALTKQALQGRKTNKQGAIEAGRRYYVATSRAKHELLNAELL